MDILKAIWPLAFKVKQKDLVSFLIWLILGIVIIAVCGILIGLLASVPVVGIIFSILGSLVGIYSLVNIVLCILRFVAVI